MNLKISKCKKCGYWFDGNARYFHELSLIEKIFYLLGWVIFPGWSALEESTKEGNPFYFGNLAAILWSVFVVPILLLVAFVVDTVSFLVYFILNTVVFPISFPYNMIKLLKVKRNYLDEEILLNNAFDYALKMVSNSQFKKLFEDYYQDLNTFINMYVNNNFKKNDEKGNSKP